MRRSRLSLAQLGSGRPNPLPTHILGGPVAGSAADPDCQILSPPKSVELEVDAAATRRWWMRRDGCDDADDVVPMDTQEQEELVGSLEQKQAHHSRRWRRVFAGFLLGYAAFLVYASFHHAWSPWELRHHSYFMEDLPSPMDIFADWIAALGCLFAVKGLLQASISDKKWMWYSLYVGIAVSVFWTYYLLKLLRIQWDVVWLPLCPLIASALSLYVDHTLTKSMQDISTLRSYMYNFKSL